MSIDLIFIVYCPSSNAVRSISLFQLIHSSLSRVYTCLSTPDKVSVLSIIVILLSSKLIVGLVGGILSIFSCTSKEYSNSNSSAFFTLKEYVPFSLTIIVAEFSVNSLNPSSVGIRMIYSSFSSNCIVTVTSISVFIQPSGIPSINTLGFSNSMKEKPSEMNLLGYRFTAPSINVKESEMNLFGYKFTSPSIKIKDSDVNLSGNKFTSAKENKDVAVNAIISIVVIMKKFFILFNLISPSFHLLI